MAIAIALIVLVLGSVLFHFLSPWQLTPLASNWGSMDGTIDITLWVTGSVFVAVNLFMAYAIIRYRYQKTRRSSYEPENKKLEAWLTGLTTVGIAALLAPGLLVWKSFVTVPDDADQVEVVGQQWHWSYRFPGADGEFGAVHARLIDDGNPFGMDPFDPNGSDDVLVRSPRLVLPVDRPVKLLLRSKDVLHNFQVAQFRAKMDLVPGQVSYLWLTPTRTGEFEVLCAELCGIGHFAMRGRVEVVEQARFDSWLASQPTYGELAGRPPGDPAAGAGLYALCTACHGPQGEGNRALNAPRLAGQDPWYVERQLHQFKAGARGAHEADRFGAQMRPFAMALADDKAIADVAAHIATLPAVGAAAAVATVDGDIARGARIYRTCGTCHGSAGQGIESVNAPRLAGIHDWYLVTQLENFQQGIRGRHPDDLYGWQMAEMSRILIDEQGVRNVVSYINTLPTIAQPAADALAGTRD
ncbi:MAG TPA: c-type cytochrome [Xanthomonadaceae bacterium]|nr:c-type cytochrome [Xanthomonadaceae bacterium]